MSKFLHPFYHNNLLFSETFAKKTSKLVILYGITLLSTLWLRAQKTNKDAPIIEKGASWYYLDNDVLPNSWHKEPITKRWKTGRAPFGYNMDVLTTTLNYGKNEQNKRLTYYFKKTFILNQASASMAYLLNIRRDDGVIVYLNGMEVGRQNMPAPALLDNEKTETKALLTVLGAEESVYFPMLLNSSAFNEGVNTLSVSLHQRSANSSDVIFDLELLPIHELSPYETEINALKTDAYSSQEYTLFSTQLLLEKTNTKHQLLLQKLNHMKTTYFIAGSLVVLLLIVSILFTFYFRKKTLKHKQTIEEHASFLEKTKQERLKNKIQNIEHTSFLESLLTRIEQVKKNRMITSSHLDGISKTIKERKRIRTDMEELAIHIDSLNTKFSQRLLNRFPNLSPNEIRHCCLIRIHLSTKEISRILHVDPRSIQTARYRIKKKLQLKETEDLISFLIKY